MKKSILLEADKLVNGERQEQYADPVVNFELIAKLSALITGKPLTARDCCLVLMAVKLSREVYKHKRDNLTDLCGYAEILERIMGGQEETVICPICGADKVNGDSCETCNDDPRNLKR